MMKTARLLTDKILPRASLLRFQFCESTQGKKKSYIMPQQPKTIEPRVVNKKIHFKNGRHLIYMNKQNLSTPYFLDTQYLVPIFYVGYLIAKNPFYLTFPAALPMMFMFEAVMILFWIQHKALHKRHIQRVYLLSSGIEVELIFANKIRRFMKNNEDSLVLQIPDLFPKYDHEIKEGKVKPYQGIRFPADVDISLENAPKPTPLQYGWTFRDKVFNNYILPGKFEYAEWEILTKVLNGITILIPQKSQEGKFLHGNFPTIEEEQQNLLNEKKAKTAEKNEHSENPQKK